MNFRGSDGFNQYNGLNIKLQSNNLFNKGLYFNANYTWSHAVDNSSTFANGNSGVSARLHRSLQSGLDKGNADTISVTLRIQRHLEHSLGQHPSSGWKSSCWVAGACLLSITPVRASRSPSTTAPDRRCRLHLPALGANAANSPGGNAGLRCSGPE